MRKLLVATAAALVFSFGASATSGPYPTKPIRLVVPYAAGGASDVLARIIGPKLGEALGQQIVVDNRGGGGGVLGSDLVAKAPPDGYTLVLANVATHAINTSLYSKMPYDPAKDFAPITLVATGPTLLVVNPAMPVKTLSELLGYARENPGRVNFASAGVGTTQHLAGELLKMKTGVQIVHVPYKGGGPALADLLGGQVQMMFPNIPPVQPFVRAGKLRAIAVASTKRWPTMPDIPTVAEAANLDGFDISTWFGILAPAGTPADIVRKLHGAIVEVVSTPEMRARLANEGLEPLSNTPEAFARYIREQEAKWARLVKASGARID